MYLKLISTVLPFSQEPCIIFFLLCLIVLHASHCCHPLLLTSAQNTNMLMLCFNYQDSWGSSNENNLSLTSKLFLCILNVRIKSCLTSNYWRNKGRSFSLFFYVTTVLPIAHASNMGNNSILTLPITSPKHVIFSLASHLLLLLQSNGPKI